ncbi:MAG: MarR family transcriptional regulator [Pseudomonadota bacterium]
MSVSSKKRLPAAAPLAKTTFNRLQSGFLIHDVSRLRRTLYDQQLRPLGITRSQWWVLAHLSRNRGEPMAQIELARVLDLGKATLGGLLARLEAAGYISRTSTPEDGRVKHVTITRAGQNVLATIETVGAGLTRGITTGISNDDLDTFNRTLAIMKSNLLGMINPEDLAGEDDGPDAL